MGKKKIVKSSMDKDYGDLIMTLESEPIANLEVLSTGIKSLDIATGIGGYPMGRIVEIYGPAGGSKTTLAIMACIEAQKKGKACLYIDMECTFDLKYAKKLGLTQENFFISQPYCGDEALEMADRLLKANEVDVVVIDSVSALVPKAELDGEMGDASMGGQARLMSQACRKLQNIIKKTNSLVIFINQIRMKLGVMFGSPETVSGGKALEFATSMRFDIRRKAYIKNGTEIIGADTKIKITKNKLAVPFKETEVSLIYGEGVNKYADIINLATDRGILKLSGSWYSYKDNNIAQGKDALCKILHNDAKLMQEIEDQL